MKNNSKNKFFILIFGCLTILLCGFIFSQIFAKHEENKQKIKFEKIAQTITNTVDQSLFKDISSTPEDNYNQSYINLRNKFIEVGEINKDQGVRWIYTLIPRDGKIVFSVDSILDENHSEPGDTYENVSDLFLESVYKVWNNKSTVFIDPYTDQWGTFVSILTPVLHDGEVVSVLGIDVDYKEYFQKNINLVRLTVFSITFVVLIIFLLIYIRYISLYIKNQKQNSERIRLKFALEGAGDGLWDWDIVNGKIFVSDRWKEMLGYKEIKIEATNIIDKLVHPEDRQTVKKIYDDNLKGITKKHEISYRILNSSNEYKWILDRAKVAEYDKNFKPTRIIGTITDIDTQKKNEIELINKNIEFEKIKVATMNILDDVAKEKEKFQEISNKLELATSCADIGVLELDLNTNLISGDSIISKIYGTDEKYFNKISLEKWKKFVFSDDLENIQIKMENLIKNKTPFVDVFRIKTPSGNTKYIKAFATIKMDKDGNPIKMIGTNIDITKEYEIDKAKSEFVSLASHQLKTPVGAVAWNLEMLLDGDYGKITKKQKEVILEIYQMNRRMSDLVNDFLNISRIELGTLSVEIEKLNFEKIAEEILLEFNQKIILKKQIVNKKYEINKELNADRKLLNIIYQNLFSNAVKYCPDGGEINISICEKDNEIFIVVKNSGNPIPQQDQSKIFERMFRASNAQSLDPNGNGLGLYLVKLIVETTGGKISFVSDNVNGTIFEVRYPYPGMVKKTETKNIN